MEKITWAKIEKGILKSNTGKYRARITKTMPDGKTTKQFCRDARTLDDARAYRKELKENFKGVKRGDNADLIQTKIKGRRMRFRELASIFEEKKLTSPVYDDPDSDNRQKQKGIVRFEDSKRFLNILVSRFGGTMIRDITHGDLEKFKFDRLREPKLRGGGRRKLSSVHRELEIVRSVLDYGATKGFLEVSPFNGDEHDAPLIRKSQENKRDRVLTFEEEAKLLNDLTSAPSAPVAADREHLRIVLLFLIDTACRHNELKQLERRDIDLNTGVHGEINIRLRTTKTAEPRTVPIFTSRLRQLLEQKLAEISDDPRALVFGKVCVKRSFAAAKLRVGIKDFTIHDCRHTAISRWIESRVSAEQAMKYTGIKSHAVFQRYLALSRIAHRKNTERIGAYYAENLITSETTTTASEAVN
jgi:integrase